MTLTSKPLTADLYETAVEIWARSVQATHHFLSEEDFNAIKQAIPTYFDQVDAKMWYSDNEPIGFSGIYEQSLEMLFVDSLHFRKGFGSQIIERLFTEDNITTVDVNEDNPNAVKFYLKQGFEQFDRSEIDGEGRPYPILHLRLSK